MATIYDDVAELKQKMQAAEQAITALQGDVDDLGDLSLVEARLLDLETLNFPTMEEGDDFDTLPYGRMIIPSFTIYDTLLHRPDESAQYNGIVDTMKMSVNGHKSQKMIICNKYENIYFERSYYSNAWGAWKKVDVTDTGWKPLTLPTGVSGVNDVVPQCRRQGAVVQIRGSVTGVAAAGVIATLPEGFRPSTMAHNFVQNTTKVSGKAIFARFAIRGNGEILLDSVSTGGTISSDDMFNLNTTLIE